MKKLIDFLKKIGILKVSGSTAAGKGTEGMTDPTVNL